MKAERSLEKFNATSEIWLMKLVTYDDKKFAMKPSDDEWSVGQLYEHIIKTSDKCLENALACADGKGETGKPAFAAWMTCFMGSFPPMRLKISEIPKGYEYIHRPRQISRDEAYEGINKLRSDVKGALQKIQGANPSFRIKHWVVPPWLNASQWYQVLEMHMRHHLRQMKRLDVWIIRHS